MPLGASPASSSRGSNLRLPELLPCCPVPWVSQVREKLAGVPNTGVQPPSFPVSAGLGLAALGPFVCWPALARVVARVWSAELLGGTDQ